MRLRSAWSEWLDETRIRVARPDALLHLAVLGLVTGLLAGAVIVVFRLFVEGLQEAILPGAGPENYEGLPVWARLALPLFAAVLLAVMFRWFARGIHVLGVARIMERMMHHQGETTPRAFLLQFFGAAIAIIGGHSVGREGPHIYLGAASGSLLGQRLSLPHNVIRALVGCGTAAGIAASFNTPLAGVVFALEVVMMEYTVASFIPVILAAVSATAVTRLVFGAEPAFSLPPMDLHALHELGLVVVLGLAAGAVSALFIHAVQAVSRRSRALPIWWRMFLAGGIVGGIGVWLPGVMGIGYDTVDLALSGQLAVTALVLLLIGKLLATSACIGLGVPGGVIGPALFIGAMLGGLVGALAGQVVDLGTPVGMFALLGMGAMMSGSLQAPLAALLAMLELTDNPQIILPGMLAVVVAGITASELFGKDSLFLTMLRTGGLEYGVGPVSQALRRIGVASVMERSLARVSPQVSREFAVDTLRGNPSFLLIDQPNDRFALMPAAELARYLEAQPPSGPGTAIDLLAIPAKRLEAGPLGLQANLLEARDVFRQTGSQALVVRRMTAPGIYRVYGVLLPDMVENAYRV